MQLIGSTTEVGMRVAASTPRGTGIVSSDGWIPLDGSIPNWQHELADLVKQDILAYAFYALLDDAELREVFDEFTVPADGLD
jgi:hypothetical protein